MFLFEGASAERARNGATDSTRARPLHVFLPFQPPCWEDPGAIMSQWACIICSFHNVAADTLCEMCQTPKPGKAVDDGATLDGVALDFLSLVRPLCVPHAIAAPQFTRLRSCAATRLGRRRSPGTSCPKSFLYAALAVVPECQPLT